MRLPTDLALRYADFAQAAMEVTDDAGFKGLIAVHVQPLLPHGMLLAVIGQLTFDHLTVQHHIAFNYPEGIAESLTQPINIRERPVVQRWLHTRAPVIACPVADQALMSSRELLENEAFGLGRLAVHGLPDLASRMGSYFSFARVPESLSNDVLSMRLAILIPLLHIALFRISQRHAAPSSFELTDIESELLVWLAAGRSNQEMAALRQRSPATIRNQLLKLYTKLGVSTRAEAVALTMSNALHIGQVAQR